MLRLNLTLVVLLVSASLLSCDIAAPVGLVIDGDRAVHEECGNGMDDDADAQIDEDCPCGNGESQSCFSGTYPHRLIGACRDGVQVCDVRGSQEFHFWGSCDGDVLPAGENCEGTSDDDCDGAIDEGCSCDSSEERACAQEFSLAPCSPGMQRCQADGLWSSCEGAIGPSAELCGDEIDNDCDGDLNEGCQCLPEPERCGDGIDNDCDGERDESSCVPPLNDGGVGGCRCRSIGPTLLSQLEFSSDTGSSVLAQHLHDGILAQVVQPGDQGSALFLRRGQLSDPGSFGLLPLPGISAFASSIVMGDRGATPGYLLLRGGGAIGANPNLSIVDGDALVEGSIAVGGTGHSSSPAIEIIGAEAHLAWDSCPEIRGITGDLSCFHAQEFYRRFDLSGQPLGTPVILSDRRDPAGVAFGVRTYLTEVSGRPLIMHLQTLGVEASLNASLAVVTNALQSDGTWIRREHPELGVGTPMDLGRVFGGLASDGRGGALACVYDGATKRVRCLLLDSLGQSTRPTGVFELDYRMGLPADSQLWEGLQMVFDDCSYAVTLLVRTEASVDRTPMLWSVEATMGTANRLVRGTPGPWVGQGLLRSDLDSSLLWLVQHASDGTTRFDSTVIDCEPSP